MASRTGRRRKGRVVDVEDFAIDNESSYEVERQKNRHKTPTHRLVYVARIRQNPTTEEDKRGEIVEYYEKFLSTLGMEEEEEEDMCMMSPVSGILLLYQTCVIHLLEFAAEVQPDILKDLHAMETTSGALLQDIRFLVIPHHIEGRSLFLWRHFMLNPFLQDSELLSQPVEDLILDSKTLVYRLCVHLQKRRCFAEADEVEHKFLVDEGVVFHLCQCTELQSPSSFLKAYDKPVDIVSGSEIAHPASHRLFW